jgi:NADPH:quinone reductase-like Zn-dependent oxidoreductase
MSITGNAAPELPAAPAVVREQCGGETMRAIILTGFGGLDRLVHTEIPKPLPKAGEVVIRVKGFGINHAEIHMASSTRASAGSFRSAPRSPD